MIETIILDQAFRVIRFELFLLLFLTFQIINVYFHPLSDTNKSRLVDHADGNHADDHENVFEDKEDASVSDDLHKDATESASNTSLFSPTLTSLLSSKYPPSAPTSYPPSPSTSSAAASPTPSTIIAPSTATSNSAAKSRLSLQDLFPGRRNPATLHQKSREQSNPLQDRATQQHEQQQSQLQKQQQETKDIRNSNEAEQAINLHIGQATLQQGTVGLEQITSNQRHGRASSRLLELQLQQSPGDLGKLDQKHQPPQSHQPQPLLSPIKVDLEQQHQQLSSQLYRQHQQQQQQQQSQQQHLNIPLPLVRQHQFLANHFLTLLEELPVPEDFLLRPSQVGALASL